MKMPKSGKNLDKIAWNDRKSAKNAIGLKSPRNTPSFDLKGSLVLWVIIFIPLEIAFSTAFILTIQPKVHYWNFTIENFLIFLNPTFSYDFVKNENRRFVFR